MKKFVVEFDELLELVEHKKYVSQHFVLYLSLPKYVQIQDKHLDNLMKYLKGFSRIKEPITIVIPGYGTEKILLPF